MVGRRSVSGALLQSKGLTELIVLTILLDARIISPTIFTAMILMALFSAALTMPLARLALAGPKTEGRSVASRGPPPCRSARSRRPTLGGRSSYCHSLCKRGLGHGPPSLTGRESSIGSSVSIIWIRSNL